LGPFGSYEEKVVLGILLLIFVSKELTVYVTHEKPSVCPFLPPPPAKGII